MSAEGPRDHATQSEEVARTMSDADRVRDGYAGWLGDGATIVGFTSPESTGFSSETYFVDVDRGGEVRREILRTTPSGETVFREYDLALQVACMRQLADVVPTPEVVEFVEDASVIGKPFYVMTAVDGRIPDDNPPYTMIGWVKDAPFDLQRSLYESGIDVLGRLGATDPKDVGLAEVLARQELGVTGLEQQFRWWRDLYDWGREGSSQPTLDAAWSWLEDNFPKDPGRDRVLWGDARVSNMIFGDHGEARAVIDWEMAGVGPGEVDLAWFLWMDRQFTEVFDLERLEGFPGEEALIARWEAAVGHPASDMDWYFIFAGVRFSITLMRIGLRTKATGQLPADSDVERNNLGTRLVARTLGLPEPGPIGAMG